MEGWVADSVRDAVYQGFKAGFGVPADYGEVDGRLIRSTKDQDEALEGKGIDAVDEHKQDLACPICFKAAFGAVMTKPCAHCFHKDCLVEALRQSPHCPLCRTSLEGEPKYVPLSEVNEARFLSASIKELKVVCPFSCGAHVQWGSLKEHVRHDCRKTRFVCRHDACWFAAERSNIASHEAECAEAEASCSCGMVMKKKLVEEHKQTDCPDRLIACKYCSKEGISRGEMESHFDVCDGAVPMSEVRKMMGKIAQLSARIDDLEQPRKKRKTES